MKLLCERKFTTSFSDFEKEQPMIELQKTDNGKLLDIMAREHKMVFIIEGGMTWMDKTVQKNNIILLKAGNKYFLNLLPNTEIIIYRLRHKKTDCDYFTFSQLKAENEGKNIKRNDILETKEGLQNFIVGIKEYLKNDINCPYLFDIKIRELRFLYRVHYSSEELYAFLSPVIAQDREFTEFILENYLNVSSIEQLASMANYSLSGFEKRFKRTFGTPAGKWLRIQKGSLIYQELKNSRKPLKDICFEYGFSSTSHFNDYCKNLFGETPGKIRKVKDL